MKKPHSLWRQETLHLARSGQLIVMASILRGLRDNNQALWIVMLAS